MGKMGRRSRFLDVQTEHYRTNRVGLSIQRSTPLADVGTNVSDLLGLFDWIVQESHIQRSLIRVVLPVGMP